MRKIKIDKGNQPPVSNDIHGRITDINSRLNHVKEQFRHILDRLRPYPEASEGMARAQVISHSVQDKLVDTSDAVHMLESLVDEYEQHVGIALEDAPTQKGVGRAIG
jgi:hypothetical protein